MTQPLSGPRRPLVYIASPYTNGDQAVNAAFQSRKWDELFDTKLVTPFAPLVSSHVQQGYTPRTHEEWMDCDYDVLWRCDACLRVASSAWIGGKLYFQSYSHGADEEVQFCNVVGIPVFYDVESLYEWARRWKWDIASRIPVKDVSLPVAWSAT